MEVKRNVGKRYSDNNGKKIKLVLDIGTLDILCRYVISNSRSFRANRLTNLRNLMSIIDPSTYINDPEKTKRVEFINKGIEARVDHRLTDSNMIMEYIRGTTGYDIDFVDSETPLTNSELDWVGELVAESLKYKFIYDNIDDIQDLCTRFNAADYMHRGEIVKEFERVIDDLKNEFRRSDSESNSTDMTFSLREGVFENAITNTYDMVTNPNRRLITGMIGLNDMVGGGFESGRVYALFGLGGIGKSLTLLNLMMQFKKYNRYYRTKDPTKTPCIVLLTMENTVVETITRMFSMTDPAGGEMIDYGSAEDVIRILRSNGLAITEDSPIDIVIKYKANRSVDTSYLYTLCEDLEDQGYEVICMIQDHIKRIRSIYGSPDLRIELGDIVNEMKVFAAEKDIPVITVSHLNRDAAKTVEAGSARGGTADLTKKLGRSNVGESLLMIDNVDCGIVMNLEIDDEGDRYMCYNLIKMRDKVNIEYIAQPFEYGSSIKLLEDVPLGSPMYRETLKTDGDIFKTSSISVKRQDVSEGTMNKIFMNDAKGLNSNSFATDVTSLAPKPGEDENGIIHPLIFFGEQEEETKGTVDNIKEMLSRAGQKRNGESRE